MPLFFRTKDGKNHDHIAWLRLQPGGGPLNGAGQDENLHAGACGPHQRPRRQKGRHCAKIGMAQTKGAQHQSVVSMDAVMAARKAVDSHCT